MAEVKIPFKKLLDSTVVADYDSLTDSYTLKVNWWGGWGSNSPVIYLDENSLDSDLVDWAVHFYIWNAAKQFDTIFNAPYPWPNPFPLGFNLYNLSNFYVTISDSVFWWFSIEKMDYALGIKADDSNWSGWEAYITTIIPYFENINQLLQVTNFNINEVVRFISTLWGNSIRISPDKIDYFKSLWANNEFFEILSRNIRTFNSWGWQFNLNFPNMGLTAPGTNVQIDFRNNVSWIVALLSDLSNKLDVVANSYIVPPAITTTARDALVWVPQWALINNSTTNTLQRFNWSIWIDL